MKRTLSLSALALFLGIFGAPRPTQPVTHTCQIHNCDVNGG
jgi:hypothetical protein